MAKAEQIELDAEGTAVKQDGQDIFYQVPRFAYSPTTRWGDGGPIIEREGIHTGPKAEGGLWYAFNGKTDGQLTGATPLEAAMRCYVASKFGDIVDESQGQ